MENWWTHAARRSSISRMWKLVLVLVLIASSAFAQQQMTAYAALKVVSRQVSPVALSRIISVTGTGGDPQPTKWNILVVDRRAPGGVREIQVANGRVVAQGPPATSFVGATNGSTIATSKLNLDSSGAFTIANHTADTSHLNFASLAYTLRTNERGQPTWIVTLQDDAHHSLGTIHINASRGNITRVEGLYHGANMTQVEEQRGGRIVQRELPPRREVAPRDEPPPNEYADADREQRSSEDGDEDENVVKAELKRLFRRTKDESERIFYRVRDSFQDFMNR